MARSRLLKIGGAMSSTGWRSCEARGASAAERRPKSKHVLQPDAGVAGRAGPAGGVEEAGCEYLKPHNACSAYAADADPDTEIYENLTRFKMYKTQAHARADTHTHTLTHTRTRRRTPAYTRTHTHKTQTVKTVYYVLAPGTTTPRH